MDESAARCCSSRRLLRASNSSLLASQSSCSKDWFKVPPTIITLSNSESSGVLCDRHLMLHSATISTAQIIERSRVVKAFLSDPVIDSTHLVSPSGHIQLASSEGSTIRMAAKTPCTRIIAKDRDADAERRHLEFRQMPKYAPVFESPVRQARTKIEMIYPGTGSFAVVSSVCHL
jgi:hypothetical protein